eukprot:1314791-Heterocapsa_arctica.AAC.1
MSMDSLPLPIHPPRAPPCQCQYCLEYFPSVNIRSRHPRGCHMMPYNVWIDRVRWCVYNVTIQDYPCKHFGIRFWGLAAASKHG